METTTFRQLSGPIEAVQYTGQVTWAELAETINKLSHGAYDLTVRFPAETLYLSCANRQQIIGIGDWIWTNAYGTHVATDEAFREEFLAQTDIERLATRTVIGVVAPAPTELRRA